MEDKDNVAIFNHTDRSGKQQDVKLDVQAYRDAAKHGLNLSQHLEREYPSDLSKGTTMSQFMQSCGMYTGHDQKTGIAPPTMQDVMEGFQMGGVVRNDGNASGIAQRMLFPEIIMQVIQANLTEDEGSFLGSYDKMIAQTQNVTSPRIDQPIIDTTAPESSEAQSIAQLAEPASMVKITVADRSYRIPTKSIGLTISDEARQATTLDLVTLVMTAQARKERIRSVEASIGSMVSGGVDEGESALASATFKAAYDNNIASAGQMTQNAWIKFLRQDYKSMSMNWLMMDIDSALAIEGRSNKPTNQNDNPNSPRIDSLFTVENLAVSAPNVLLVDTNVIGANTVVGLDSRFAIRRVVNISAAYEAIQEYVMRRSTSFRVDYGETSHRLYTDAWKKRTMTL